jgi:hypothetical protein
MHDARTHTSFRVLRRDLPAFILLALAALLLILYGADYAIVRIRIARHGSDSVLSTVTIFYAAPIKGGKVSIFYDQPQTQSCVRSIFPHLGYAPCWYLQRRTVRVVDQPSPARSEEKYLTGETVSCI